MEMENVCLKIKSVIWVVSQILTRILILLVRDRRKKCTL